MSVAKEVVELLKGTHFYLDTTQVDPWRMTYVLCSHKSDNMISLACLKGEYSAVHCIVDDFPSILPKHRGLQKKKAELFSFYEPSDIAHWMEKYMDSSKPFYPEHGVTYYKGLEDGLPRLHRAATVAAEPAEAAEAAAEAAEEAATSASAAPQ